VRCSRFIVMPRRAAAAADDDVVADVGVAAACAFATSMPTPTANQFLFKRNPFHSSTAIFFSTSAKIFSNGPMIGEKKDDDDSGSSSTIKVLDKSAVLQEVRAFNDPQIDARRCVELIGSLLRLISRGDVLTPNE
jgi:hypothetical protein